MSHYYSTIEDYINITDNEMLHDTSMMDSIPLVQSESSHPPTDSYYNITGYTDIEPQVDDGESDEPVFVDPGVEEDGIYNKLKSRRVSTFTPYEIRYKCSYFMCTSILLNIMHVEHMML